MQSGLLGLVALWMAAACSFSRMSFRDLLPAECVSSTESRHSFAKDNMSSCCRNLEPGRLLDWGEARCAFKPHSGADHVFEDGRRTVCPRESESSYGNGL